MSDEPLAGAPPVSGDRLLENLVTFGRTLRTVGIPAPPDRIAEAAQALTMVDLGNREHVFQALRAMLVSRSEDLELFQTLFEQFWTGAAAEPWPRQDGPPRGRTRHRQARFTLVDWAGRSAPEAEEREVVDRAGTLSDEELLQRKRFTSMTPEELQQAKQVLARLAWTVHLRLTRRRRPDARGRAVDLRRTLQRVARTGSVPHRLPRRRRVLKQRPVVLLADISGSMEDHSRLLLQFFHLLARSLDRVETFVFATRLTRITKHLRLRNVDRAIDQAALDVMDWSGGTRIGACLGQFNREWNRRVLGRGAVVVIVSDGCDAGDPDDLARELRYIQHRCHRLIWLHPYAGNERFEPRVAGLKAAISYVDVFLPVDNVRSLVAFADALAGVRHERSRA